jgi:hypothetical protein
VQFCSPGAPLCPPLGPFAFKGAAWKPDKSEIRKENIPKVSAIMVMGKNILFIGIVYLNDFDG